MHHHEAEKQARILLGKMTLQEKAAQMLQLAFTSESEKWARRGVGSVINAYDQDVRRLQKIAVEQSRLHIPILFAIDCIHGHALNAGATVFPSQLAMAQSFDRAALQKCAEIVGVEALTDGIPWVLSPVLCLGRDPRWGRVGETFGEDPYLAGELGAAMVRGYNKAGVVCCPKHYIAHGEVTGGRDSYEVQASNRHIKAFFDPPFKKAVDAGCGSIMSAQHVHDGQPFCANTELINGLLKGENGFSGLVITDNSTASAPFSYGTAKTMGDAYRQAVEGGSDMLMFCSKNSDFYHLAEKICAAEANVLQRIDDAVLRILTLKFAIGLFENPYKFCDKSQLASDAHLQTALEITEKSITLLKNERQTLPLRPGAIRRIAVVGPAADNRYSQYGDWTYLNMPFAKNQHKDRTGRFVSYLEGITERAQQAGIETCYCKGCEIEGTEYNEIEKAAAMAAACDVIIAVVGDLNTQNGEHHDRCHLGLTGLQNALLDALFNIGKPVVVLLSNGRPHCIPEVAEKSSALLEAFNSGIMGGKAAAKILFGDVNPSGKLAVSIPRCEGQIPVCYNHTLGWHADKYIDEAASPLFPFGFGLSYTAFAYSNLSVPAKIHASDKTFKVSVQIKNTGTLDGEEVVQLYVYQKQTTVLQPLKALKAFERVRLKAGEEKTVMIAVAVAELAIVDYDLQRKVQTGAIEIMVGGSSGDSALLKTMSAIE